MRHGGCARMEIQTEFSTLSNLTEDLVQLSAPHVATSGKSKISPHSESQEHLSSRKGLRHGTVQLAGIGDRNCSTKGARKLNGSPNLVPQRKGRRRPTPQFQTKKGRALLACYSSPRGRQGHGICIGGWGQDRDFYESAHEKGDEINYKQRGGGNHIEQPTGNAVPKLAANSCGKLH
jgi:hypothetical protein